MEHLFRDRLSHSYLNTLKLQLEYRLLEYQAFSLFSKFKPELTEADFVEAETLLYKVNDLKDRVMLEPFAKTLSPKLITHVQSLKSLVKTHYVVNGQNYFSETI